MKKLGWTLSIAAIIFVAIFFWKRSEKSLVAMAPKQCMFNLNDNWSVPFQKSLVQAISNHYETSNNPDEVIDKITMQFPEIDSIQAQICSSDKICFHVDGLQPVFILNESHVVTSGGHLSVKGDFSSELLETLPAVSCSIESDTKKIVQFMKDLPQEIFKKNSIAWDSENKIVITPLQVGIGMQCIACADRIPLAEDVQRCFDLHQTISASVPAKKKSIKKIMLYDIRFKNQIIVKSGG